MPESVSSGNWIHPFRTLVQQKLQVITDAIASRSAIPNPADTFRFLSMTDLPVYKMIAVGTRLNNSSLADQLLSTYQSLIAAKYAEAYIHGSAEDLRRAIARYGTVKSSTSLLDEATKLNTNIDTVESEARSAVMQAFSQTSNAWQLVEQLHRSSAPCTRMCRPRFGTRWPLARR